MSFLRNEFLKIFEDLFTKALFTETTHIYDQMKNKKIKAKDLILAFVTFWTFSALKYLLEKYSN